MNLTELKTLWKEHDYRPVKRLGQNFLIDNNIRDNILKNLNISLDDTVLEIGPGFCVMTFEIAGMCRKLYAVEKDGNICSMTAPLYKKHTNTELICRDILDTDIKSFPGKGERIVVFGNIPYYITTPIIEKIIEGRECVKSAHIVVQDEIARRVIASPGTKDYGSISCFVQFYTRVKRAFRISKNSFYPRPQVDSCLLSLEVLDTPSVEVEDEERMFTIIRKSFSERRKKILNPLSHGDFLGIDRKGWEDILTSCGIDPALRAENLSLTDFAKISDKTEQLP